MLSLRTTSRSGNPSQTCQARCVVELRDAIQFALSRACRLRFAKSGRGRCWASGEPARADTGLAFVLEPMTLAHDLHDMRSVQKRLPHRGGVGLAVGKGSGPRVNARLLVAGTVPSTVPHPCVANGTQTTDMPHPVYR